MIELIRLLATSFANANCSELKYRDDHFVLGLLRSGTELPEGSLVHLTQSSSRSIEPMQDDTDVVRAEASGMFTAFHPVGALLASAPGQKLKVGGAVGYLVLGDVLSQVATHSGGVLESVELQEGELVGFGQEVGRVKIA
ncbi:hypothetical protein [Paraburkholderia sp. BL21I4N1]|uniref:hypothetical protein n=1 Tax=Paraburkholderia sp. BL21I4N1 TaxID=1938801 RepID=UPI000CFC2A24|nr:hypothetical protein [Paraburkholderia sp. BL21I4N1]PQV43537.1 biotin carboxyl carrier protein [Paraburkholderia sp. BL21I4N1]